MTTIHVTASREYDVLVQPGLLDDAGAQIARTLGTGRTAAIVAGETVFSGEEATVYAQWSPIDQVPTEPTAPADTVAGVLERHKGTILIVGGMLVLVAVGLAM